MVKAEEEHKKRAFSSKRRNYTTSIEEGGVYGVYKSHGVYGIIVWTSKNSLLMENETISSYLAFLSESESNNKNIKDSIFHNYYDFRNKINNLQ